MAYLSVAAALATMGLKFAAFWLTGSVSLFSDAAESTVNLLAGLMALAAVTIAGRPADENHAYGHDKVEYFSSGAEGALILVAAVLIVYTAGQRFLSPAPLTDLGPGLVVAAVAAAVNLLVARTMLGVARERDSITIEADAHHLMTDVWTSAGVIAGLLVVWAVPEWAVLDPLVAVAVAVRIIGTGFDLVRRSVAGLMDVALPAGERELIDLAVRQEAGALSRYRNLRTRKSGARRFIDFELLVPGSTTVLAAHELCDRVEAAIEAHLPNVHTTIHVEPEEAAGPGPAAEAHSESAGSGRHPRLVDSAGGRPEH
jgi:cation diffusion facilitator family transporter